MTVDESLPKYFALTLVRGGHVGRHGAVYDCAPRCRSQMRRLCDAQRPRDSSFRKGNGFCRASDCQRRRVRGQPRGMAARRPRFNSRSFSSQSCDSSRTTSQRPLFGPELLERRSRSLESASDADCDGNAAMGADCRAMSGGDRCPTIHPIRQRSNTSANGRGFCLSPSAIDAFWLPAM